MISTASTKLNPYYDMHSKLLKLEGPNKAMLKTSWLKEVNGMLRSLEPSMTPRGLLNYYPHCDNALLALLYPTVIALGAPVNIAVVPEPIQAPALPANPVLDDYRQRELANAPFVKYTAACLEAWKEIMGSFDDTIYSHFLAMAGANDVLDISLVQIFQYIFGPAFETKTEENIMHYMNIINAPLDLDKTLLQNFETVEQAHKVLESEAPTRAMTTNTLCAVMKSKLMSNSRLFKAIEHYYQSDGITELTATFEGLRDSVVRFYPLCIQPANLSHLALACDADHHTRRPAGKRVHLGATAIEDESEDAIAAAAYGKDRKISDSEWKAFQAYQAAAGGKKAAPKELKVGTLCFLHGWQGSHDSTTCKVMANDAKYTAAQKTFVAIPAGHNLMVDGVKCSVKVKAGYKAAP